MKRLVVLLDGKLLSSPEGFLIRKAPGNATIDFGQFLQVSAQQPLGQSNGMDMQHPPLTADAKSLVNQFTAISFDKNKTTACSSQRITSRRMSVPVRNAINYLPF